MKILQLATNCFKVLTRIIGDLIAKGLLNNVMSVMFTVVALNKSIPGLAEGLNISVADPSKSIK